MHNFYSVDDLPNISNEITKAIERKRTPSVKPGQGKTMVLLFFNSSLRTRLSTEIAAKKLGMDVIIMDMSKSWAWEMEDGNVMNFDTVEHIKDAAQVISSYVDVVGIRAFAHLRNKEEDEQDRLIKTFMEHANVPVINLESSILHPLQSLADLMTIEEHKKVVQPKIVLTWAPHVKPLPHAVSNSFLEWMRAGEYEVIITHPSGMELSDEFTQGHRIELDQGKAFQAADFVYAKNWSSYQQYGENLNAHEHWIINEEKMALTNEARFMHCLPVRRNLVATDNVLDHPNSLIYQQAKNRLHAATYIIEKILLNG